MTTRPRHNITSERAADLLKDGQPLTDFYVDGELKIETSDTWNKDVIFDNCIIECFSAIGQQFDKPVKLTHCHFKNCHLTFVYFFGGLIMDNCTFDNYLDFQAGGNNKTGNPIIIINNDFNDFVNFFDCYYENEVTISCNKFQKGTNLLGKPHNIQVSFEIAAIIKENIGQLDLDNEGQKG